MAKIPWERIVLYGFGIAFLSLGLRDAYINEVGEATAIALIAVICFAFANLAGFKKFKGWGFEGELWDDKKKEAADLIERLKDVVAIYSTEVVRSAVQQGRFADGKRWQKVWPLYESLVGKHDELGQKIDFTKLKNELDTTFLFDMCMRMQGYNDALIQAHGEAGKIFRSEFGGVITDPEAFRKRQEQLNDIVHRVSEPLKIAQRGNLAAEMLRIVDETKAKLHDRFGVELKMDEEILDRLQAISTVWQNRPVEVTPELISWADRET